MNKKIKTNKCNCIICGQYRECSLEHIIPKALGNETLKTYDVCKDCNSKLGDNVDSYLSNNFFIQMIRQALGIAGQSGKIPNPFKNGIDENGRPISVDQDFKPHIIPNSKVNGSKLHIIAETKEQVIEIGLKSLKRMNADDDLIQQFLKTVEAAPVHEISPTLSYDVKIDCNRLYLAALKIAYEYAFLKLGEDYRMDSAAEKIRTVLRDATSGNYNKLYQKVSFAPKILTDRIKSASHIPCHLIMIGPDKNHQLIVNIFLFMSAAFSFSVCVSENAMQYQKLFKEDSAITDIIDIRVSNN